MRQFYERQNERLDDWLEVDTLVETMADGIMDSMNPDQDHDGVIDRPGGLQNHGGNIDELLPEADREKRRKGARNAKLAININVVANVLLLVAKGIAATQSSSLSLIASLVDSALDLLCTAIVWTTNRLVAWRLKGLERQFPVGRRRLEPLGILVFSVIMIISYVQILQESVTKLYDGFSGTPTEAANLPAVAIGAMAATVILKGIIWFGCIRVKTTQVQALAQDCKTDVYFNTFSLLFPLIGHQAHVWWLDPLGAAFLSLFIIYDWATTCFENVLRLCGSAVDDKLQKKLTFLAYRFSPLTDGFKSIKAYHAGDGVWAEYDILLDEKTPLRRAHDISETLQYCCEGLDEVDRAFVTVDCKFSCKLAFFDMLTNYRPQTQRKAQLGIPQNMPEEFMGQKLWYNVFYGGIIKAFCWVGISLENRGNSPCLFEIPHFSSSRWTIARYQGGSQAERASVIQKCLHFPPVRSLS